MLRPLIRVFVLTSIAVLFSSTSQADETGRRKPAAAATGETPQELLADSGRAISDEAKGQEAHDAQGRPEPNILEFKPSLMVSTVLVFTILLLILWKFAWGPLSIALQERERKQEETIRQAELARSESERLLAEHKRQMDSAAEQVRQMLEEARRQAEANANTIVQKAQAEAESAGKRAGREIETARDQALSEIWSKTADLAVSVAGKVLAKEMTPEDHRRLVETASNELPAHAGANGHGGHRA